jgi:energy-coupling factor transporter ATP-binding protein EcfA2
VKIKKVALENFLSYGKREEIKLGDLSLIVGPNGAGKTNLVRALTLLSKILVERTIPDIQSYAHSPKEPFTVEVELELSDEEKKAVREWLALSLIWDYATVPHDLKSFSEFLTDNWEKLVDVAPVVRGVTFKSTLSTLYPWSLTFELSWGAKKHTYELFKGLRGKGLPNTMESVSKLVFDELKNRGYSFPPNQPPTIPGTPQPLGLDTLIDQASPRFAWIRMPTVQLDVIGQSEAEAVRQTSVYADFTRFLMERGWGTIEISFEQLFALIFNTSLVVLDQWRGRPPEHVELAEEAVEESSWIKAQIEQATQGLPRLQVFDLESAVRKLFELCHSRLPEERKRFGEIVQEMTKITGLRPVFVVERLDKNVPKTTTELRLLQEPASQGVPAGLVPPSVEKLEKRRVYAYRLVFEESGGRTLGLEQAAAGDIETLLILTAVIGYQGRVVVLDEPGQSVHPARQRKLLEEFRRAAEENNQLIAITHSPHFVSSDLLERTIRITPGKEGSHVHALARSFPKRELKFIEKNDAFAQALFSRLALVCEGETEYFTALISLPKALKVNTLADLEIVPILSEGDSSIDRHCEILEKLGVEYHVFCDEKAVGTDRAQGAVRKYREKCFPVPCDDTWDYLKKSFEKEFDECEKNLSSYKHKDMAVLRCVLENTRPPDIVEELAKTISELLKSFT